MDSTGLIEGFSVIKKIKKREFLLKPNQNCSFLAFVKKGKFRVYFIDNNGTEVTVWFSWEGMMVGDLLAFYKNSKALFYVQAIDDCEVAIIPKDRLEHLYNSNPEYLQFGRRYAEYVAVNVMERILTLQVKSPKERYLELLSNPNYMQQIPLKYLASYLGITDSSLSRIRRRIS